MKKIIFLILITSSTYLSGQDKVVYSYDLAGNRIKREVEMTPGLRAAKEIKEHVEKIAEASLHIYPNPTEGILTVELRNVAEDQKMNITLYDLRGNIILQKSNVMALYEIDISNQPASTYVLQIVSGEIKTEWKVIKK